MIKNITLHYTNDLPSTTWVRRIEKLALADRRTLRYRFGEPCDPRRLIEHQDVSHILETYEQYQAFYGRSFHGTFEKRWSGATLHIKSGEHFMLINPEHSQTRRTFTIGHEFGHLVFQHHPIYIEGTNMPLPRYSDEQELEANCYALAILLPYAPLLQILKQGASTKAIACHYGISKDAVEMRIKITGLWDLQKNKQEQRLSNTDL